MNRTRRTFVLLLAVILMVSMIHVSDVQAGIKVAKPGKVGTTGGTTGGKSKSKNKNNNKNNNKKKPAPKAPKANPVKKTITTGYLKSRTGMMIHVFAKVTLPAPKPAAKGAPAPKPAPKTKEILMEITLHEKTKVTLDGKPTHISKVKPDMYMTIEYATMKGHDKKIAITIDAVTKAPEKEPAEEKTKKPEPKKKKTPKPAPK